MSNGRVAAVALADGRRLWTFSSDRAPLLDVLPYFRGRGNLLTPPAVSTDRVVVGGADGFLYTLSAATGRLVHEEDLVEPVTAPPLITPGGMAVATFAGQVIWRPDVAAPDTPESKGDSR
jgi:outer membrane protein assembly factor BamB